MVSKVASTIQDEMNILVCPDSFKGTFSAQKAAKLISKGIKKAAPKAKLTLLPIADGGEGTLDALNLSIKSFKIHKKMVRGPLEGKRVSSRYGVLNASMERTAVIEMSEAAGLNLVPFDKRNPLLTTTFGVGELILAALDKKCTTIIVTVGGSSTTDAGIGMAQALGVKFLDSLGREIAFNKKQGYSGHSLGFLDKIDVSGIDSRIKKAKFIVATDVENPLYGRNGAAYVYAKQKGASGVQVTLLDGCLKNFASVVKQSLRVDISKTKGAGAAGGLGAGLMVFLKAKQTSGIQMVLDMVDFEKYVRRCDLMVSGEGRIDAQTIHGKTIAGVVKYANKHRKPLIAIGGCLGKGYKRLHKLGVKVIYDSSKGKKKSLSYYKKNPQLISEAAFQSFKRWKSTGGANK